MAFGQHGCLFIRHRTPRPESLLPRIRRRRPHDSVLQSPRRNPRLLLLHFRPTIRFATNGAVAILVWMAWSENQYDFW